MQMLIGAGMSGKGGEKGSAGQASGNMLTDLLKAEAAKKLRRAKAKAEGEMNVGKIKQQQGNKEAEILSNLMSNLRNTILF